jgi:hypothetical protein
MIPEAFVKVVREFVDDLLSTYPELRPDLAPALAEISAGAAPDSPAYQSVFDHVTAIGPQLVFGILTENADIFASECILLPGVNFALLWRENITEQTKQSIWRYLRLLTMSAVGADDAEGFKETMAAATKGVQDFFGGAEGVSMPDPAKMEEKFKGFAEGKLGDLAREIADEAVGSNSPEQMEAMLKNPAKLFELVSSVGSKIDQKLKSGQIKENELVDEAAAMLQNFKGMPGFEEMMKQFGGAMGAAPPRQDARASQARDRLKKKLKKRAPAIAPVD